MRRTIVVPAVLAGAALDELKDWLAITTDSENTFLTALLRTAVEACEAYTGQMPLEATCEEIHPGDTAWRGLATRPVQAVTGVEGIPADGARFAMAGEDYLVDLDAEGGAHIRLLRQGAAGRIAVRFVAGLAPDWPSLPESLRHGIIRMAADAYRSRNAEGQDAEPRTAVLALWRPWRRMRLA